MNFLLVKHLTSMTDYLHFLRIMLLLCFRKIHLAKDKFMIVPQLDVQMFKFLSKQFERWLKTLNTFMILFLFLWSFALLIHLDNFIWLICPNRFVTFRKTNIQVKLNLALILSSLSIKLSQYFILLIFFQQIE